MQHQRTVLVIEDNELNREILCSILEDDYHVLPAENGAVGLELLRLNANDIALILLDLQMPVLDGYGFLTAIRNDGRFTDIPIIVATASNAQDDEIRCLDMGASDFVTKPYNSEVVRKRVESMIRLRETSGMLSRVERDPVTGVYTKNFFNEYAGQMIASEPSDMVCMEIESYRKLTDRYDATTIEAYLKRLFSILSRLWPKDAIVGRLSDSRFAYIMPTRSFTRHSVALQKLIVQMENAPIQNVKVNFGVYIDVDRSLSVDAICYNALMAIDQIRNHYGVFVCAYDNSLHERAAREQQILDYMRPALNQRQFKVYYQPKYDIKGCRTVGAEALVRWIHPEMGFMNPGEFIPLFEHNGFIHEVDRYILDSVCRDLRRWIDEGLNVVPVSVNVSQVDFDQSDLAQRYAAIVDAYRLPHELIHFEITETANATDSTMFSRAISEFHAEGFKIELDDFGAGYSTIGVLCELPIDVIKVDMSLIRNMFEPKYQSILSALIFCAQSLGLTVVAEGVETQEQVAGLLEMSGEMQKIYIQGYFYSRPIPAEQFETFIGKA